MKSSIFNVLFLVFSLTAISQNCDNVTINLSATPATNPTSFDGSIEVELVGNGVVETYFWSNGYRGVPTYWETEVNSSGVNPVNYIWIANLDTQSSEELIVATPQNAGVPARFQVLSKNGEQWVEGGLFNAGFTQNGNNLNEGHRSFASADFDGDGIEELVFGYTDGASPVIAFFRADDSNFNYSSWSVYSNSSFPFDMSCDDLFIADLEGDGDLDVFFATGGFSALNFGSGILINENNLFVLSQGQLPSARRILPLDVDNDGDLDVWLSGANPNGLNNPLGWQNGLWLNMGGVFQAEFGTPLNNYDALGRAVESRDFNADGNQDLLFEPGGLWGDIAYGNGNGEFNFSMTNSSFNQTIGSRYVRDFNYDGFLDFLTWDSFSVQNNEPLIISGEINFGGTDPSPFTQPATSLSINSWEIYEAEYQGLRPWQGKLLERAMVHSPWRGETPPSPSSFLVTYQDANINQNGLPPGGYELCITTTDGCSYCNSVTVNTQLGNDCTDPTACNYNPNATEDDGSCEYGSYPYDCNGNCLNDADQNGICDEFEQAAPFNPDANGDGVINLLDMLEIFPLYGQPFEAVPCFGGD